MSARLLAYEHVVPGFETVIGSRDVEMGRTWNLWWNTTLSDDPESWDGEVRAINRLQASLGELSPDCRLLRAQMAELCRHHFLFPESVDILCREIGAGRFSRPVKMGCEGRDLLDSLGYHDQRDLVVQQARVLKAFQGGIEKWLMQEAAEGFIDLRVSRYLGVVVPGKATFVGRLTSVLQADEPSRSAIKGLCEQECRRGHGEAVFATPTFPFNCFRCQESDPETGRCPCCWALLLEAGLMCAGSSAEAAPYRRHRFVQECVLAYAMAVNAWLAGVKPEAVAWPVDGEYITADGFREVVERVHTSLGGKEAVKEWLAACLLKTLKGNQRWHPRTELIDGFPEATGWLDGLTTAS